MLPSDGLTRDLQPDAPSAGPRLRVLLTRDRARTEDHWTQQLPRLLGPMGIQAEVVGTGTDALDRANAQPYHAAVVDIATPTGSPGTAAPTADAGGLWLLQVLQRSRFAPPVVVVNSQSYSQRQVARFLNEALRLGAFSVINKPVDLEHLLATIARLLQRHHDGRWPGPPS